MFIIASTIFAAAMAIAVMFVRVKASKQPVTSKKIILPPLFMSTGAVMFLFPIFRIPFNMVVEALVVGALFSILLIKTSKFEIKENAVYLKRSKTFFFLLIGLFIVRLVIKAYVNQRIPFGETSSMFFLLAFGMIVPWRVAMYVSFKKLEKQIGKSIVN